MEVGAFIFDCFRRMMGGESLMQVCTRCKKEFEEKAHLDKHGHPFCDACYQDLIEHRKEKQAQSGAVLRTREGRESSATCESCGERVRKDAIVCDHCGAPLIAPKRPSGVIVVVVLVLISALMELYKLVSYNSATAVFLGFSLSATAWRISSLLGFGICVYIAIGFFKLKKLARTILLCYILFSMVDVVLTGWNLAQNAFSSAIPNLIILLAINLAYFGVLLFLVVRLKKHFVR